ncbi:signal peptidase I [Candidatus Parcubacteria bacterium]|nr:signal peptidase I [Candidatus Parcubacteria bacterium]
MVCRVNGRVVDCPHWLSPIIPFFWGIGLIFLIVSIISMWKIFEKAGFAGWKSIIPIYNLYILLQIVNRPVWWIILFLIPFVSGIIGIILMYYLAKSFGKGIGFTIGLVIFSFVFLPILAFGDSTYGGARPTVI